MIIFLKFLLFWSQGIFFIANISYPSPSGNVNEGKARFSLYNPVTGRWAGQKSLGTENDKHLTFHRTSLLVRSSCFVPPGLNISSITRRHSWDCHPLSLVVWKVKAGGDQSVPTCFSQASVCGAVIYSWGHLNRYHKCSPSSIPLVWGWCWCPSHREEQESN